MPASPNRLPRFRTLAATALSLLLVFLVVASQASAAPAYRGLQLHSLWGDTPEGGINRELDITRDLGANVVRLDVGWSSLETDGKGQLSDWYVEKLDRFINEADARGMKTIVTLWGSPCWASSAPESIKQGCEGAYWDRGVVQYPPTNPADFGDMARWVTARYGSKLAAFEVWNEPNLETPRFWKSDRPAADYAKLVRAAYAPAKQGNPNVPVIVGALGAADGDFLKEMYANGINGFHDGISIHPYNEWRDPADMWQEQWKKYTLIPGIKWVNDIQRANGDNTGLWLTELGWPTCEGINWCVSEAKQAEYTARAVQMLQDVPYVKAYTIYDLRNEGNDKTAMDDNFGIVTYDYQPKPVYQSLKRAWAGSYPGPSGLAGDSSGDGDGTGNAAGAGSGQRGLTAGGSRGLQVRIKRRGRWLYAYGVAPRGSRVELTVKRCRPRCKRVKLGKRRAARLVAKTGLNGRFRKRLGKRARLRRSRLTARVLGPSVVVSARVRSVRVRIR